MSGLTWAVAAVVTDDTGRVLLCRQGRGERATHVDGVQGQLRVSVGDDLRRAGPGAADRGLDRTVRDSARYPDRDGQFPAASPVLHGDVRAAVA